MSGFQRLVSYINLYEGNKKIRNVGFAKIEQQNGQCKIEMHLKGTGYTGLACPVYLFVRKENRMEGIPLGKIQVTNGAGAGTFNVQADNIVDSGYKMEQVGGFLIFVTERVMFASEWDDREILREEFSKEQNKAEQNFTKKESKAKPGTLQKEVQGKSKSQEEPNKLDSKFSEKENHIEENVTKEKKEEQQTEEKSAEELKATEAASQQKEAPEIPWEQKWQFILENYPVMTPFEEKDILCVRLELKDLRLLPRSYWYLGNNSFLLHGFFNYRYLILGVIEQEKEKRWFVGVPGIYQSQERVMASIFGFTEYRSEKTALQKTGQFGYWYRFLN